MSHADIFVVVEHIRGQVSDITYVLLAAGREIVQLNGGKLIAILFAKQAKELSKDIDADKVLFIDHPSLVDFNPEFYLKALSEVVRERQPRLVLFGDTSIGADLAGPLSVHLGLPLISSCRMLGFHAADVMFTSQICGGKIMVEGKAPGPTALIAMIPGEYRVEAGKAAVGPEYEELPLPDLSESRMSVRSYIEPEQGDIDITKENILVSVGRGIQNRDNLQFAQDLADAIGGALCASRPIVDQGWLPPTRLVGKSGKKVKPKVYLALGISGAPEHTEAMDNSEVIIAVNTDPSAPIFGIAKYGTTVDLLDLAPILTEKLQFTKTAVKAAG